MTKDKRWLTKAGKRIKKAGTAGSFTRWSKAHGYDGVTSESIAAGLRAGGKIAKKAAFAKAARKARHARGGVIEEEYSLGGIFSGLGSGAGMGASIGSLFPGPGTLIGGAIGGVAGLIGGIAGHVKENREEDAIETQQLMMDQAENKQQQDAYLAGVSGSENPYAPTFPFGGMMGYADAEVEDDEILQKPGGKLKKMSGKTHEQGGIDVTELAGTRVYSDREIYKTTGKTFAEEADTIRKRIAQLDKQLV